jgi:hypothetical protein
MSTSPDTPVNVPAAPADRVDTVLPSAPSPRVARGVRLLVESQMSFAFEVRSLINMVTSEQQFYVDENADGYVDELGNFYTGN